MYSRSVLINGQKSSGKAWDSPFSSLFQFSEAQAKLVPIWLVFSVPLTMRWSREEEGVSPTSSGLYRPLSCRDQSSMHQFGS